MFSENAHLYFRGRRVRCLEGASGMIRYLRVYVAWTLPSVAAVLNPSQRSKNITDQDPLALTGLDGPPHNFPSSSAARG
jgi:hypothetical protein